MVGVNEGIDPHPDSYIRLDSISSIMGFERVTNLGGFGHTHFQLQLVSCSVWLKYLDLLSALGSTFSALWHNVGTSSGLDQQF